MGHRMSKIIKSRQSCKNGHLPYHCSFYFSMHPLNDVAWICVRSKDAQKQLERTSLMGISNLNWLSNHPPPPPEFPWSLASHQSWNSNSLRGRDMDIFWNHTIDAKNNLWKSDVESSTQDKTLLNSVSTALFSQFLFQWFQCCESWPIISGI